MPTLTGYEQPIIFSSDPRERTAQLALSGKSAVFNELGIGTSDPDKRLHILTDGSGCALLLERVQSNANAGGVIGRKARGTLSALAAVVADDDVMIISGWGYSGSDYRETCRFDFEVDGSVSDATHGVPGRILFRTSNGSTLTEKMRLTNAGNLGINVSAPDQILEVGGRIHISDELAAPTAPVNGDGGVLYVKTDGKPYWISNELSETDLSANTTYTAGNGLTLSSTTFTVCDPATLSQLTESTDATDDKILLWDESASSWKYMTLDDLQDSIDTGGGGGEANEYSFKTISVSGQSDVVADTTTDTLTLAGGSNVTITTNAGSDTITVASANTTYTAGDGLDLTGTAFSTDLKSNGGLVIESTELAVDLGASSVTGTLAVGDGGTGQTSYTNGQLLIGNTTGNTLTKTTLTAGSNVTITNGTGTISIASADTNTTYSAGDGLDLSGTTFSTDLKSNGGLVIESTELAVDLAASSITGTLAVDDGGTGQTSYTNGQLLIGNTTGNTLTKTTLTAGSNVTITNGTGTISIAATDTNTWRTVTAGGNTLSTSETLAFTAGTGISIAESAGAVTITNSVTNTWRTVTAGGNTLSTSETLAFTAGSGISIAESAGAVTITASGGGVSLSGSTNNTVATVTGSNALIGEANLTFDGNSLIVTTGSTSVVPLTVTGATSQTANLQEWKVASTTKAEMDENGRLGIGMAPTAPIDVEYNAGEMFRFKRITTAGHCFGVIDASTTNGYEAKMHLLTGTTGKCRVFFGDTVDANAGMIDYDHGDDSMAFSTNAAEALVIDSAKIVDFKKAVHEDTGGGLMQSQGGSGGNLFLEIKVAGTQYYLPLYA